MTTKLTLLALLAIPLIAAPQVLEKPGDALTIGATTIPPDSEIPTYEFHEAYAKHVKIHGHFVITKQEAADVVKALEILSAQVPLYDGIPASEMLEESRMVVVRDTEQRRKDLAWARGVLETWRGKVKEAK